MGFPAACVVHPKDFERLLRSEVMSEKSLPLYPKTIYDSRFMIQ